MFFEISSLGGLILLALNVWAFVSILGSHESTGHKVLWFMIVLILPLVGFLVWLLAGPRSQRSLS